MREGGREMGGGEGQEGCEKGRREGKERRKGGGGGKERGGKREGRRERGRVKW